MEGKRTLLGVSEFMRSLARRGVQFAIGAGGSVAVAAPYSSELSSADIRQLQKDQWLMTIIAGVGNDPMTLKALEALRWAHENGKIDEGEPDPLCKYGDWDVTC